MIDGPCGPSLTYWPEREDPVLFYPNKPLFGHKEQPRSDLVFDCYRLPGGGGYDSGGPARYVVGDDDLEWHAAAFHRRPVESKHLG
jgi:hypothetical protein